MHKDKSNTATPSVPPSWDNILAAVDPLVSLSNSKADVEFELDHHAIYVERPDMALWQNLLGTINHGVEKSLVVGQEGTGKSMNLAWLVHELGKTHLVFWIGWIAKQPKFLRNPISLFITIALAVYTGAQQIGCAPDRRLVEAFLSACLNTTIREQISPKQITHWLDDALWNASGTVLPARWFPTTTVAHSVLIVEERITRATQILLDRIQQIADGIEQASDREYSIQLFELITKRFNKAELSTLCFYLEDIDYESLGGKGLSEKALELVKHLERHHHIQDFVDIASKQRPDVPWPKTKNQAPGKVNTDVVVKHLTALVQDIETRSGFPSIIVIDDLDQVMPKQTTHSLEPWFDLARSDRQGSKLHLVLTASSILYVRGFAPPSMDTIFPSLIQVPNIKVGVSNGPEQKFLRRVIERRLELCGATIEQVFEPEALEMLIQASGGNVQQLIKLTRKSIQRRKDDTQRINSQHSQKAINDAQIFWSNRLDTDILQALQEFNRSGRCALPPNLAGARLLQEKWILKYDEEGHPLFDYNPLIVDYLEKKGLL